MREYQEDNSDRVLIDQFLGRLEREINKGVFLARFFIACGIRMDHSLGEPDEAFSQLFDRYRLDQGTGEVSSERFADMLSDFDVVEKNMSEFRYFADEYIPDGAASVSVEDLASDYGRYIEIVEALLNMVNGLISEHCQMAGSSLQEELAGAREGTEGN